MDEPQLTYRIGWVGGSMLVGFAVLGDLLQVLLSLSIVFAPASDLVTLIVEGFIVFFFFIRGVNFFKGKKSFARIMSFLGETAIEAVPFLDGLPTLTAGTIYQIHSARAEDKLEYEESHTKWEEGEQRQRGIQQWNQRQSRVRQLATTAALAGAAVATGGASAAAEGAVAASRAGQAARVAGRLAGAAERGGVNVVEKNLQNRSVQAVRRVGDIVPRPAANDETETDERLAA
ncbi:MAG TPA: hypothetical protein VN086_02405 [Candidatus Paceibacterota bacterium]|nr:hypothetical protein [Candidatus Paceibacterota bacterium]